MSWLFSKYVYILGWLFSEWVQHLTKLPSHKVYISAGLCLQDITVCKLFSIRTLREFYGNYFACTFRQTYTHQTTQTLRSLQTSYLYPTLYICGKAAVKSFQQLFLWLTIGDQTFTDDIIDHFLVFFEPSLIHGDINEGIGRMRVIYPKGWSWNRNIVIKYP